MRGARGIYMSVWGQMTEFRNTPRVQFAAWGAGVGLLVAAIIYFIPNVPSELVLAVWPGSFFLLGLYGLHGFGLALGISFCVVLNVLLYGTVAYLIHGTRDVIRTLWHRAGVRGA